MIKSLSWDTRLEDSVTHSDPAGLHWSYYIYRENEDCFNLKLISEDGNCDESLSSDHKTLEQAKCAAQNHFEEILSQHVNINN